MFSPTTNRRNQIRDCKIQTDRVIHKNESWYSTEYVADLNGTDIATVL